MSEYHTNRGDWRGVWVSFEELNQENLKTKDLRSNKVKSAQNHSKIFLKF